MDRQGIGTGSFQASIGRRQLVITSQLIRVAGSMHHVDEMFSWLASTIVQAFNVQAIQFWTTQLNQQNQPSLQLRTMVQQDPSLPQQIFVNNHVVLAVGRIMSVGRHVPLQAIGGAFPAYQAEILGRYGLYYCAGCFLASKALLPPASRGAASGDMPTPLRSLVLLLWRQAPAQNVVSAIDLVLEQAIQVASNHDLLLPTVDTSGRLPAVTAKPLGQITPTYLLQLVPRRLEDADVLTASNPFSDSTVIADKQARRLYLAIDGRKNLDELCTVTNLEWKQAFDALRFLLKQHRIQLYEPDGAPLDSSQLFNE